LLSFDETVCGTVSIVTAADDTAPMAVPGVFANFPLAPAFLTWSLAKVGGSTYVRDVPAADFRTTLPAARTFWNVYARGSYQNAPRFSNRQYFMPGRFLYDLANGVDTRSYPNGLYEATVQVSDMRGNNSAAALQFKIENHADRDRLRSGAELGTVGLTVDLLQVLDPLDVGARLCELDPLAGTTPPVDVVLTGVVGRQRILFVAVLVE